MRIGYALCALSISVWACSDSVVEGQHIDDDPRPDGTVGPMVTQEDPNSARPDDEQPSSDGGPSADVPTPPPPPGNSTDMPVDLPTNDVAAGSRVRRLKLADFDRVVSDLLLLDVSVADAFPEDVPTLHGYFEAAKLRVSERLNTELTLAAESLAQVVREDSQAYDGLTECSGSFDDACRDRFLTSLVSRAYRRPATQNELDGYAALFDRGRDLVQSGDDFADGVQVAIEAVLQSPKFIYHIEQGAAVPDAVGTPLTDHEVASRLSFMLWGTLPDEELRAVADAGMLSTSEQIAEQARRMIESPELEAKVLDFHERWMQVNALSSVSKDAVLYEPFSPNLVSAMQQELRLFVTDITLNRGGGIRELLTAPFGFSNALLDTVYASGVVGNELTQTDYSADSPRVGILTQAAFLSGHSSSSTTTSPILRGIFILDRLLCYEVPPPPANATAAEPPAPETPPVTTRDMYTWKTSMDECRGCHELINPVGFAFEGFDAIGRHRTTENGAPVDTTGTAQLPQAFEFSDAKELVHHLATLEDTRACYARHLLEYSYGRPATDADEATLNSLTDDFALAGFGTREALISLASSTAFIYLPE